ncbi:MAG: hypothetical protein V2A69_16080, partial [Pseudomonadota bacterium]
CQVKSQGIELVDYSGPWFVAWSTAEKNWEIITEEDKRSGRALLFWDTSSKTNVYGPFRERKEAECVSRLAWL